MFFKLRESVIWTLKNMIYLILFLAFSIKLSTESVNL